MPERLTEIEKLLAYFDNRNMLTHAFYLDELIDSLKANNEDMPPLYEVVTMIDTQARLDMWFQETMKDALDYCHPRGDGTWACMTVDEQVEYIVRPDFTIVSASDGMSL